VNIYTVEAAPLSLMRTRIGIKTVLRVMFRTLLGKLRRQKLVTNGAALMSRLLDALLRRDVDVWRESPVSELIVEHNRVVGAVIEHEGRRLRVQARDGVVIAAGGFARNEQMRQEFAAGRGPVTGTWTSANPGDTGEVIKMALALGAATDMLDEAWWMPSWFLADGTPMMCLSERTKPHSIIVDSSGERYFNEAVAYQEAGQRMYAREKETGGAIPSWLIVDQWHRTHYTFMDAVPGRTPKKWIESGVMKRGRTLDDLAAQCGIDPDGLRATVDRFNALAAAGVDEDFHRGEGDHERFYGDVTHEPNACLGPIDKAPFYAVALYPGDIGTSGGLLCDENSRVLDKVGRPIEGLYATGNSTASVMGRKYPGPGASIAASAVFGYAAAEHACGAATSTGLHPGE
jgi:3-oxosteroid 1-dehydrogenase